MKFKSFLLILLFAVVSFSFTDMLENKKEINSKVNLENDASLVKNCCSFSGKFKYDSKGFSGELSFKINFGLAGPPPNGGGNSNIDWGEIILTGNATHGNYIAIKPPKEYIGRTITIGDSNIDFINASCGSELLQFINLKAQKGKVVLKEKTMIKIVNLPTSEKKGKKRISERLRHKERTYKKQ
jgi:hypothetical protein